MNEEPSKIAVVDTGRLGDSAAERDYLMGFIIRFVDNRAMADDLVQETLLKAHNARQSFRGDASRRTWLCATALNSIRDRYRRQSRRPEDLVDPDRFADVPGDVALEDGLGQSEMDACIRGFILRLPERQCNVIALHDIAGLTHREIGATLGITAANSRVVLHRARAGLKQLLEDNCTLRFGESVPCEPSSANAPVRK
ncbi:MAG: sigma-70 family RNA polymerase sigma factor [Woeseiaceae bacterium]|nr:sigma-70 family RNA polymerase sigma factor [Woeseiaceae bacterium]